MREIKFRAWQKQPSLHRPIGMYVVNDIVWYDKPNYGKTGEVFFRSYTSSEYLEDVELMQYTGLKDKNGKEIYEGDLLSSDHLTNAHNAPQIVSYSVLAVHGDYLESYGYTFDYPADQLEVIGNICENKDLIHA